MFFKRLIFVFLSVFSSLAATTLWANSLKLDNLSFQIANYKADGSKFYPIYGNGRMQAEAVIKLRVLDENGDLKKDFLSDASDLSEIISIYYPTTGEGLKYVDKINSFEESNSGWTYTFYENPYYHKAINRSCDKKFFTSTVMSVSADNAYTDDWSAIIPVYIQVKSDKPESRKLCLKVKVGGKTVSSCDGKASENYNDEFENGELNIETLEKKSYSSNTIDFVRSTTYDVNWLQGVHRWRQSYDWEFKAHNGFNFKYIKLDSKAEKNRVDFGKNSGKGSLIFWTKDTNVWGVHGTDYKLDFAVLWDPASSVIVDKLDHGNTHFKNYPADMPVNQLNPITITSFFTNWEPHDWCRIATIPGKDNCSIKSHNKLKDDFKFTLYDEYGNESDKLKIESHNKQDLRLKNN